MLMGHVRDYSFSNLCKFITKRMKVDLCLDTHSAGQTNLANKVASLNEVK